jgi:hypothetical protein
MPTCDDTPSAIALEADTASSVLARFAALASAIAFALHYAWENVQCSAFFIHASVSPTQLDMVRATLGDVAMTWVAYAAVAVAVGRWDWPPGRWGWRHRATLVGAGLAMSIAVERYALAMARWSYTANNPRLPVLDVSVLPVAQMVLLLPATFGIAVWLARRLRGRSD